ncbi:hypothetical protein HK100_009389, partial [Physocladia obscura]
MQDRVEDDNDRKEKGNEGAERNKHVHGIGVVADCFGSRLVEAGADAKHDGNGEQTLQEVADKEAGQQGPVVCVEKGQHLGKHKDGHEKQGGAAKGAAPLGNLAETAQRIGAGAGAGAGAGQRRVADRAAVAASDRGDDAGEGERVDNVAQANRTRARVGAAKGHDRLAGQQRHAHVGHAGQRGNQAPHTFAVGGGGEAGDAQRGDPLAGRGRQKRGAEAHVLHQRGKRAAPNAPRVEAHLGTLGEQRHAHARYARRRSHRPLHRVHARRACHALYRKNRSLQPRPRSVRVVCRRRRRRRRR